MEELPLCKAFQLIEPGPVVLVTTASGRKKNIMTISWHMVMDFTPRIAFVTGPWNHSFKALMQKKECVIAVPGADLSARVVKIGACSGSDTDKFRKFALTPVKAISVKAPLIAECLANIECRVVDHIKKHDIFVLDAVHAWIDTGRKERRTFHANGDGTFVIDGKAIDHRELMRAKIPPGV
ncbi:MAG TPA: flavin reductase family protein [Patescibacteria group bacterium]|nr:flavin reductase family protein [Patescibacteria group bacterium]